ncbi:MAG: RNA polymerase sigma factor [Gemmatimonadales bacterium]
MRQSTARFERCYQEYGEALRRLARVYAPTHADVDDLAQDIWFAVWRALPSFRGDCSERTYIYRIAHNRGLTFRSRLSDGRLRALEAVPEIEDPGVRPDARAEERSRAERLLEAVRALPDTFKQVVVLHLEGLGNQEIAAVTGLSESNVAVRLSRARGVLRDRLGPIMEEA